MSPLDEAIALIEGAGYRVSKPKAKSKPKSKDRVGPTCVAKFADGEITRMSTYTSLTRLDWARGERLAQAAHQSRWRTRHRTHTLHLNLVAPAPPAIIAMHFEQGGAVLARRPADGGVS